MSFSTPVDEKSALLAQSYATKGGLSILDVKPDPEQPGSFLLKTEPMDGDAMNVDELDASGVKTAKGAPLGSPISPAFLQGIVDVHGIQNSSKPSFPFPTGYENVLASASCVLACYPRQMVEDVGFTFVQQTDGGPYTGLKVQIDELAPEVTKALDGLDPNEGVHVLFSGGFIQTVDGETRLRDAGYLGSSLYDGDPLPSPKPYPVTAKDVALGNSPSQFAKSLQGIVVELIDVKLQSVTETQVGRRFTFTDASGAKAAGWALSDVVQPLKPGQSFGRVLGTVHQPSKGHYELVVMFDSHLEK